MNDVKGNRQIPAAFLSPPNSAPAFFMRVFLGLAVLFLAAFVLTGCGRKYEAVSGSSAEESGSGLREESESGSSLDGEEDRDSLIMESDRETEAALSFSDTDETVYVTGSSVNLRKNPGQDGEVVTALQKGISLKRTGYGEGWSRVVYQEEECYISSQYVSKDKPAEPETAAVTGNGRLIAIDAGHQAKGNSEKEPIGPGASETKAKVASGTAGVATGIPEYKLNLAVSLKLKQELLDRGYKVYMIRETDDVNISNAERAEMAEKSGADIFVRVHANSLNDQSVHGALTMCQTAKNPYNGSLYGKSTALSKAVVNGICSQTGFKNRGVQETDSMSGINWCDIPVTIVEMGFMSNADEDKRMAGEEYREKIAKGIADGIDAYYESEN